ncbi:hypothetical protein GCM10009674_16050 [Nesterenkonia xinjiangensis]
MADDLTGEVDDPQLGIVLERHGHHAVQSSRDGHGARQGPHDLARDLRSPRGDGPASRSEQHGALTLREWALEAALQYAKSAGVPAAHMAQIKDDRWSPWW